MCNQLTTKTCPINKPVLKIYCVGVVLSTYLRNTLISFSRESSLPLSAFLSMILTAYIWPGLSLLSARRTTENAPLKFPKSRFQLNYQTNNTELTFPIILSSNIYLRLKAVCPCLWHPFSLSSQNPFSQTVASWLSCRLNALHE